MTEDFDIDVDDDGGDELGFEPAVSATGAEAPGAKPRATKRAPRRSLHRRLGAGLVLVAALVSLGGTYAAFAASSGAPDNSTSPADIAAGRQLYQVSCIACHGANLQGVKGRAPSLYDVGGASVYFQVSTGRMPLSGQGADVKRKTAKFNEQQTKQLAAYIQSVGGGPTPADQAARRRHRRRRRPVRRQLRVLPRPHVQGRSAVGRQDGSVAVPGDRRPDLRGDDDRAREHADLQRQRADTRRRSRRSSSTSRPSRRRRTRAAMASTASARCRRRLVFFVAGVGAVMIVILWIGAKSE